MRLGILALSTSALLLSGCSWMGSNFGGGAYGPVVDHGQYKTQTYQLGQKRGNPCQIPTPNHPVPRGCDPASVTIGTAAGGFSQQPQFGAPQSYGGAQYASNGYGSHAGDAHAQGANYSASPRSGKRKPRLRGSLSMGLEKNIGNKLLDYRKATGINPVDLYDPTDYNQGRNEGTQNTGTFTEIDWTAASRDRTNPYDEVSAPNIGFDDAWSTPLRIAGGVEFIASPNFTVFANAGYTYAEGEEFNAASIEGTVFEDRQVSEFQDGALISGPVPNSLFIANQKLAEFSYDFSNMERYDFEAGGRLYLDPIVKSDGYRTLTPFIGASAGASHYNGVSFSTDQSQLSYSRLFENTGDESLYYDVDPPLGTDTTTQLYDSQWVASGQLNLGLEWQATPKTAFALETGVRVEGARDYSNGTKGDKAVSIPLTLRGSYNF